MHSNSIVSSDLPYLAYVGNDTPPLLQDQLPQTEEGQDVIRISEMLSSSSVIAPEYIALISLAAAAQSKVLNRKPLLWVNNTGEAVMAFEPGTHWLWYGDPQQLSLSGRHAVVIRVADGHYAALVNDEFIDVEGDEALYKALLTAVYQCGRGIVTENEGKALRHTLAMFMRTEADRLGGLWMDKQRRQPTYESSVLLEFGQCRVSALVEQCSRELVSLRSFSFVPKTKNKGKWVENLCYWANHFPLLVNNTVMVENSELQKVACDNIYPSSLSDSHENMMSVDDSAINGKRIRNDVSLPLMATAVTTFSVKHPASSRTVRAGIGGFGITAIIFAGKQLFSWYQGHNNKDVILNQPHSGVPNALSYRAPPPFPDIRLENTDDDFSISAKHTLSMSSMSDIEKIGYRLMLSMPERVLTSTITTTVRHETDDVSIERFDLSCVDKGQQQSLADVLRQIGETLNYPVSELAKAAQVIIYYERFGQCPSEKDIEKIEFMARGIDTFISSFLSFLPGGSPLSLVQNIGGPLFQMLADALDGKDLDMGNVNAVNEQLLFLARTTWDFTPRERHGEVKQDKITLPNKTGFKKNKISAVINRDSFNLQRDGEHYIGRSTHSAQHVTYSALQKEWVFCKANAYFYEEGHHKKMVNDYGVDYRYITSAKKYPDTSQGISIDNENNIMRVLKNDNTYADFVLMTNGERDFNVESDFYKINGASYGYAKKTGMENRVIKLNKGSFFFEANTAKINKSLREQIDNDVERHTPSEDFRVTTIMQDGFSYDEKNDKYLKYNNGYYRVETDENNCEYISRAGNKQSENIYIKKNKEGFFDVDPGFSWGRVARTFIRDNEGYFIESKTSDDIQKNCLLHDGIVNNIASTGVLRDDNLDFYFSLDGQLYEVAEYAEDYVTIKSKFQHVDDITLYMTTNYFIEGKKQVEIKNSDFIDLMPSACKIKRSPPDTSCATFVISKTADTLLRAKANQGAVNLDAMDMELNLATVFPNSFFNTKSKNIYFKHNGVFYRASLTNGVGPNALRQATLHVYYKGFWGQRKNIVSLVYDRVDGKTIIQTQEEKLQSQVGMTARESVDFIRDHNFFKIPNFGKLDEAVLDINRKNSIKFIELGTANQRVDIIREARVLLGYRDYNFEIYSMMDVDDTTPFYVRGGALSIRSSIQYANEQIDIAIKELKNDTPNAQKYLGYVLANEDYGFIHDFSNQLRVKLAGIKIKINENNIKLIAKNREAMPDDTFERDATRDSDTLLNAPVHEKYYHKAAFPERDRTRGVYAFVPLDRTKNIYVCLDRLYFIDPTHPETSMRKKPYLDITETLIHEGAHSAGVDPDIAYTSVDDGKLIPVLDAIDELGMKIYNNNLKDKSSFIVLQKKYMNLHPEYSALTESMQYDGNALNYLFSHDIGFRANVLLNLPDFLAIFARDLAANSAVKLRAR